MNAAAAEGAATTVGTLNAIQSSTTGMAGAANAMGAEKLYRILMRSGKFSKGDALAVMRWAMSAKASALGSEEFKAKLMGWGLTEAEAEEGSIGIVATKQGALNNITGSLGVQGEFSEMLQSTVFGGSTDMGALNYRPNATISAVRAGTPRGEQDQAAWEDRISKGDTSLNRILSSAELKRSDMSWGGEGEGVLGTVEESLGNMKGFNSSIGTTTETVGFFEGALKSATKVMEGFAERYGISHQVRGEDTPDAPNSTATSADVGVASIFATGKE